MTLPAAVPFLTPLVSIFTDIVLALRVLFSSTDLRTKVVARLRLKQGASRGI